MSDIYIYIYILCFIEDIFIFKTHMNGRTSIQFFKKLYNKESIQKFKCLFTVFKNSSSKRWIFVSHYTLVSTQQKHKHTLSLFVYVFRLSTLKISLSFIKMFTIVPFLMLKH